MFGWRWLYNFDRAVYHRADLVRGGRADVDLVALKADGIIVRRADEMFNTRGIDLLKVISVMAQEKVLERDVQATLASSQSISGTKSYRLHLAQNEFTPESPLVQLGIQPRLLSLVNGYLGMRSRLQYIDLWLDLPTADPPRDTQMWHQDFDDKLNVKTFIYLNEVSKDDGPFCFIPGTHPRGTVATRVPPDAEGRVSDEEMASAIPPSSWKVNTGPPNTVILADTNGYHKGLQPQSKYRLLLTYQYTSVMVQSPRRFSLSRDHDLVLDGRERAALSL